MTNHVHNAERIIKNLKSDCPTVTRQRIIDTLAGLLEMDTVRYGGILHYVLGYSQGKMEYYQSVKPQTPQSVAWAIGYEDIKDKIESLIKKP